MRGRQDIRRSIFKKNPCKLTYALEYITRLLIHITECMQVNMVVKVYYVFVTESRVLRIHILDITIQCL